MAGSSSGMGAAAASASAAHATADLSLPSLERASGAPRPLGRTASGDPDLKLLLRAPRHSHAAGARISWHGAIPNLQDPDQASRDLSPPRHSFPVRGLDSMHSEPNIGAFMDYRQSAPGTGQFPERRQHPASIKRQSAGSNRSSSTSLMSLHRMSELGTQLMSQQEEEERSREQAVEREQLNLPDLLAASKKKLPTWKSSRVQGGKAAFIQRLEDSLSEGADDDMADAAPRPAKRLGPGGVPLRQDSKQHQPREEDLMYIASSMGLVKQPQPQPDTTLLLASSTTTMKKAKAVHPVNVHQASPLGVKLSVLTKFADTIHTELSTAEVVTKYINPQTAQLGCRYIDLVNEKHVDHPSFYLIHCWRMSFSVLVQALRQHFALVRQAEDDVVLWVDFFCVNQHRALGPADLPGMNEIMRSIDKAIFVIDRSGQCFQRSWVMYELWQAALNNARDTANLAGVAGERLVVLPGSFAWDDVYHSYITTDIGKSLCANDRQRLMLQTEMQKCDLTKITADVKDLLRASAKFSLSRSTKLAIVNPRRFIDAATTHAMLLYHHARYIEAEDAMRSIKSIMERVQHRELQPQDEAGYMLHLAMIYREKGVLQDAQKVLVDFNNQFKDVHDPIYQTAMSVLVDLHCGLKAFTKAEMLCRKCLEQREKQHGRVSVQVVKGLLQMAAISAAQRLYDEASDHAMTAMKLSHQLDGPEGLDASACYHALALSHIHSNRQEDAGPLLQRALVIRLSRLGTDHPITLESKSVQATILVDQGRLLEAEVLVNSILRSRVRSYGPEHHDTLETLGSLADLLRSMNKVDEALFSEKRMLEVGQSLLRHTRMNRFRSLQYICMYLKTREHLLDKAAMFLAKVYIVYKEKLGSEADLTLHTKQQLLEIILNANSLGRQALHNAEFFHRTDQFAVAEELLKQAWSLSKLVKPEEDHAVMAQGLADALFGQEKAQEGKAVMRAAGLSKGGGVKENLPTSYLRWLNKRVAKYLEKRGEQEERLGP